MGETLEDSSSEGEEQEMSLVQETAVLNHNYVFWIMIRADELRKKTQMTGVDPNQQNWEA
jgi:hypothetical protein